MTTTTINHYSVESEDPVSTELEILLPVDAPIGDLPDLDLAVLAGAGDDVVVVRAPRDVQHRALVTGHQRHVRSDAAHLQDMYRVTHHVRQNLSLTLI